MKIYLTAIIKSKPGNAVAMKTFLNELVIGSTQEKACLQYDLHQSTDDENTFVFYEIWENQEGLNLHNQQAHIKTFIEQTAEIIDGPVVLYQTAKIS